MIPILRLFKHHVLQLIFFYYSVFIVDDKIFKLHVNYVIQSTIYRRFYCSIFPVIVPRLLSIYLEYIPSLNARVY